MTVSSLGQLLREKLDAPSATVTRKLHRNRMFVIPSLDMAIASTDVLASVLAANPDVSDIETIMLHDDIPYTLYVVHVWPECGDQYTEYFADVCKAAQFVLDRSHEGEVAMRTYAVKYYA